MASIPDGWRHVGRYSEGPCQECGYICQQLHMPAFGDALCSVCRAIGASTQMAQSLAEIRIERRRTRLELETAYKRIAELEDALDEARRSA